MFTKLLRGVLCALFIGAFLAAPDVSAAETISANAGLRLARFDVDATPPVGSHLAYDPVTNTWDMTLRARGVVLLGAGQPIVLCAIDWIGVANEGYDAFRETLAAAAGTIPSRVTLHALHQHDAPDCDFGAEKVLKDAGLDTLNYDGTFAREVLRRLDKSVRESVGRAQPVTHLGLGQADVREVASNRRIIGPDGKVSTRYTATKDPVLRAAPEGVIDPIVSLVSFWNGDAPLAVLSYYATHPQSYYRTGVPNPDFPGMARFFRQLEVPEALHVHFNGAGGNIGAGKYNDGAMSNRVALARRMADGMKRAWDTTKREPISADAVKWTVESVQLPVAKHLKLDELQAQLKGRQAAFFLQGGSSKIAWVKLNQAGRRLDVSCLTLGRARLLHMPGELFVEYQLAAKGMQPDRFVAMAAYGDYGPGYIGTAIAYEQGGYETSPGASNVAPEVEEVLMKAMKKVLAVAP
jgi:hypothetical protein